MTPTSLTERRQDDRESKLEDVAASECHDETCSSSMFAESCEGQQL